MASPFRFLTRFFSSRLQAYILPLLRTWQAQTCEEKLSRNLEMVDGVDYKNRIEMSLLWCKIFEDFLASDK